MKHSTTYRFRVAGPPDELMAIALRVRKARNAACMDWFRRLCGGRCRGKQRTDTQESTRLYHAVRAADEDLETQLASTVAGDIASYLAAKVDWRKNDGERTRKRVDAITDGDDRPPYFTTLEIPCHNKTTAVAHRDKYRLSVKPLRESAPLDLELATAKVPGAMRRLLLALATGEEKLPCSTLSYRHDKRAWYWLICISREAEPLDSDVAIDLWPTVPTDEPDAQADRPFRLDLPGGKEWYVGDGRYLIAQVRRCIAARKAVGYSYRHRRQGAGHGRRKYDHAVAKWERMKRHHVEQVRRKAILDIARQCERAGAGTLIYHKPSAWVKEQCWFARRGLDWDWTRFEMDLKNVCARRGVAIDRRNFRKADLAESECVV